MDSIIFLSGTTRGGTLEGIGRAFTSALNHLGIELIELSLLDMDQLTCKLKRIDLSRVRFALSCVGMGLDLSLTQNGEVYNLWNKLGIPCITLHGDSPAYFFDRHVVYNNNVVSLYAFAEHCELRRRLPKIKGPISTLPPILLNELAGEQIDRTAKMEGTLLFLKNGKDPDEIQQHWRRCMDSRSLRAILELADELANDLNSSAGDQIDSVVTQYFENHDMDVHELVKLRLFFIAQLDDYLRAVKCTLMATALMDFPVHIRGNDWKHVDFSGKKATYIDDCNYVDSIGLIRGSLGMIDMSPNTASLPHDRVMRAYGARTLCLTNSGQQFLSGLPCSEELTFEFSKESLQSKVSYLLAHKADAIDMGVAVAEQFRKANPPERSFEKMLDYVALTKLDQLSNRPEGLQDFFLWPPQLL
jgi:hypothetical protein